MLRTINDPHFRVEVLTKTPNPQQITYAAMHQDYSDELVFDSIEDWPSESRSGDLIKKNLLNGGRGHYGPFEHPQIVFNCGGFPHSAMQQIRTHRNISMDVQSFRYTGKKIAAASPTLCDPEVESSVKRKMIEDLFYLRPAGTYKDRQGKSYTYSPEDRLYDIHCAKDAIHRYSGKIKKGYSEEHARGVIPFDVRQDWVLSCNARSAMHLFDVRGKLDVQLEARTCIEMMFDHFKAWMPEVGEWYEKNRWQKGRLAP